MLPTRPASGFTWPSLVLVPQAQHARQTPSQQAQAAQQARDATQPIYFVLMRVDGVLQKCDSVVGVLETAGMRFSNRRSDSGLGPGA